MTAGEIREHTSEQRLRFRQTLFGAAKVPEVQLRRDSLNPSDAPVAFAELEREAEIAAGVGGERFQIFE